MIENMDQPGTNLPETPLVSPLPSVEPIPVAAQPQLPPVAPAQPAQQAAESFLAQDAKTGSKFPKFLLFILIPVILIIIGFLIFKFVLPNLPQIGKPQEVTITYWGLWEPDNVMRQVFDEYEKAHPGIKINYVFKTVKDYRETLASSFAQDTGPDVFRFHNTWVPMFKNDLSPIPSKIMDNATFEASFYPVARTDLKIGTSYAGVPLEIDGLALFVNDDIFTAAGKTYPTNWDSLRQTALDLCVSDASSGKCGPGANILTAGVALGRTENVDHWSDILGLMMLQNGANLEKPAECVMITDKENCYGSDALTYFTLFAKNDYVWNETLPNSTRAFSSGKLAMYFGPSWEVFEIKRANPNLKFTILPVPQVGDDKVVTWASYWVEGVAKKSKNQDAAWEFVKYLSDKGTMEKLYKIQSQSSATRPFGEPYSRVEMASLVKDDPYVGPFISQAPTARSWYLASRTFDNGLNDKIIKYYEDAVNAVLLNKSTAQAALQTAASGVSQILAQYGISASVVK
jgi:multiple sugar transport system substrate-binding protein